MTFRERGIFCDMNCSISRAKQMTAINMITLWGYGFHIYVGVVIKLLMMRWAVFKQFKSVLFKNCDR